MVASAIRFVAVAMFLCGLVASGGGDDQGMSSPEGLQSLPPAELRDLIASVAAHQQQLEAVDATFEITVEGIPACWARWQVDPSSAVVGGQIGWARSGTTEFLSLRYDLPEDHRIGQFFERDLYLDGAASRQIQHFVATHQVLITRDTSFTAVPAPVHFFLMGLSTDLASLLERGSTAEGFQAETTFLLHLGIPWIGPQGITVEATVRPDLDYAVTEWRWLDGWGANIEWKRDGAQSVVPVQAVLAGHDGTPRWTLRTTSFRLGSANQDRFTFRFQPGMLVTDHEKALNGEPKVYLINDSGAPEEVVVIRPSRYYLSSARLLSVGAISAGIVAVGVGLRLWRLR